MVRPGVGAVGGAGAPAAGAGVLRQGAADRPLAARLGRARHRRRAVPDVPARHHLDGGLQRLARAGVRHAVPHPGAGAAPAAARARQPGARRADHEYRHDGAAGRAGRAARTPQHGAAGSHPQPPARKPGTAHTPVHQGQPVARRSGPAPCRAARARATGTAAGQGPAHAHPRHHRPLRGHDQPAQIARWAQCHRFGARHRGPGGCAARRSELHAGARRRTVPTGHLRAPG